MGMFNILDWLKGEIMPTRRKDSNHNLIRKALEAVGLVCYDTSKYGEGYPDVVAVRDDGRVFLVEIKSDTAPVQPAQCQFMLRIVNPCYRIFFDAEQAARSVME